jgi:hypothetical protein
VISKSVNPKLILTVRHYNVRVGSKTVLTPLKWDVCITPESRHRSATLPIAMSIVPALLFGSTSDSLHLIWHVGVRFIDVRDAASRGFRSMTVDQTLNFGPICLCHWRPPFRKQELEHFKCAYDQKANGNCIGDGMFHIAFPRLRSNDIRRSAFSVAGLDCTYNGRLLDSYTGTMDCPDRQAVPLKLWLK